MDLPVLILGVDPGPVESALVIIDTDYNVKRHFYGDNLDVASIIVEYDSLNNHLVCEFIQSYGNITGKSTFFTCKTVGQYEGFWNDPETFFIYARPTIKGGLVGSVSKVKDKHIRNALRQRFGESRKGSPLEGITKHKWAALAVAVFHLDCIKAGSEEFMVFK